MLESLSLNDKKWREIALKITKGDKDLADEIVSDMYIRRYENDRGQEINEAYIALTLHSIYRNKVTNKTDKKCLFVEDLQDIVESPASCFELGDEDKDILSRFKELDYTERELIELSYDYSLRDIERIYGINYGYVYKILTRARKKVLRQDYKRRYNNKRLKNRKMKKSIGLGDTIKKITKATGIEALIKKFTDDCGCEERQDYLNRVFKYKLKPKCLTAEEIEIYSKFVKERKFTMIDQSHANGKIEDSDVGFVIEFYNVVFGTAVKEPECRNCQGTAKMIIGFVYDLDIVYANNIPNEDDEKKEEPEIVDQNNLQDNGNNEEETSGNKAKRG